MSALPQGAGELPPGGVPDGVPGATSANSASGAQASAQAAIEQFVELHSCGQAPDPAAFVARFPEPLRPELLARIREFLAFDGLLGHQEWEAPAEPQAAGRAFGDFQILDELGRGGMGIVYLAHQRSLNRRVALKVMASGLTLSKRHVERFRREAAAAAQLRHPAIVPVHSFAEVDGTFAFAMDYVAGRNLAEILDDLRLANGPGPGAIDGALGIQPEKGYVAECAMLCAQLASALAAAHQAGVVHRDLKPRNVMLDERRQARLLDFGLAKSLGEGSISMSGEITGTAHYMSPEQTLGKRVVVDHRADIWALGVILYELLALRRPFDGKNLQQIVYEICFKEPVPLQKQNPKVPRDLVTICQKALEKDPQNRYRTAADFEADLLRFLRWEPIHARPAGLFARAAKWMHRHRTETRVAGAACVVAAAALGWSWYRDAVDHGRAEELLGASEAAAQAGEFDRAIEHAIASLRLHDDAAVVERVERYRASAETAATKRERDASQSRRLSLESNKVLNSNRELGLQLALEAVKVLPSAESRSAVLDALGCGYRTTKLAIEGGALYAARWSPDGRLVVTTGTDGGNGNAMVWEANGALRCVLRGHRSTVPDAEFHPDGSLVATAGVDGTVRLWHTSDGTAAGTWKVTGSASLVRFDARGTRALVVALGGAEPTHPGSPVLQVFDVATGTRLGTCTTHKRPFVVAALSPCGTWVASGGDRHFVLLWDAATGTELAKLPGQVERPRGLAWSPQGNVVAITGGEGDVHLYEAPSGRHLCTVAHSARVDALAFDAEGERLLTGGRDQTARLWRLVRDAGTGAVAAREQRTFVCPGRDTACVGFDAKGRLAVAAGGDGIVRVFDTTPASAAELMRLEVGNEVLDVTFDPDGRRVLARVRMQHALVWDFTDTRGTVTLRQRGRIAAACFDATGDRVVTSGDDEYLRAWNAHDGRQLWASAKLGDPVLAIDVDDAGELVARSLVNGRIAVHRLADGEQLYELEPHGGAVPVVRFAARGTRLLSAGADGRAVVWNTNDRSRVMLLERPTAIAAADLSADARLLATVDKGEAVVRLWSVPDGAPRGELRAHGDAVRHVRFRPDGAAVLTAGSDGSARVLDLDGRELQRFAAGSAIVHAAWSLDGTRVLTSSLRDNHGARLWNVADGTEVLRFGGHLATVESNQFSRDGQWAVTASADGTARIWPTDPVAAAHRLQLPPLTAAQRQAYALPPEPK